MSVPAPAQAARITLNDLATSAKRQDGALAAWLAAACAWMGANSAAVFQAQGEAWIPVEASPRSTHMPMWMDALLKSGAVSDPGLAGRAHLLFPNQPNLKGSAILLAMQAGRLVVFWLPGLMEAAVPAVLDRAQSALQSWRLAQAEAEAQHSRRQGEEYQLASDAFEALNHERSFHRGALALCGLLASRLSAERVSLCRVVRGHARLVAINHTEELKDGSPVVQGLIGAAEECADQGVPVVVPTPPELPVVSRLATTHAREQGMSAMVLMPLHGKPDESGMAPVVAVLILEFLAVSELVPSLLQNLGRVATTLGPRIEQQVRESQPWYWRAGDRSRSLAIALVGPSHTAWKLAGLAAVVLLVLGMLIPWPYTIRAPFTLRASRRFQVVAPFDGRLAEASVKRLESVANGQALLALDTSRLEVERAGYRADLAEKRLAAEQARQQGKTSDAAVAEAQARSIEAKLALTELQITQAKVSAPFAGWLLGEDPSEKLGASVKRGELLLELVDAGGLYAEIKIPADRVAEVDAQAHADIPLGGELACEADPGHKVRFTLAQTAGLAELDAGQPVVRTRASLAITPAWARPGVEGVARIELGRRPVLIVLARKTINWFRTWAWM